MTSSQNMKARAKSAILESAVFEMRYSNAYQIWDKAGRIWDELNSVLPNLELVAAEPRKTHFTSNNQHEYAIEMDRLHVKAHWPHSNLADFFSAIEKILDVVFLQLEILEISRVGFRQIWTIEHPSISSASASVLQLGLINVPKQNFGIENAKIDRPDIRVRWENDRLGAHLQVRAETRKISMTTPIHLKNQVPSFNKELNVVVYDMDYYTLGTVNVGQFSANRWLAQAVRAVKRDSKDHMSKLEK